MKGENQTILKHTPHTMPPLCLPRPPLLAAVTEVLSSRPFLIQSVASCIAAIGIYIVIGGFMARIFPRKVCEGVVARPTQL